MNFNLSINLLAETYTQDHAPSTRDIKCLK